MEFKEYDISMESYRDYNFEYVDAKGERLTRNYRIVNPKKLFIKYEDGLEVGTTHRVVDSKGKCHLPPASGFKGCVISFENFDKEKEFTF